MKTRIRIGFVLLGLAALTAAPRPPARVAGAAALHAQTPDSTAVHPEARAAIDRLWSPYCPGMMLQVCPSPGGEMLRDSIERMARSGLDADSIVEVVLADYGEEYRAEPRTEGIGGLAWYIPPIAFAAGVLVVGAFLARRRGRRSLDERVEPPSEAEEERLREAMAELDASERPDF